MSTKLGGSRRDIVSSPARRHLRSETPDKRNIPGATKRTAASGKPIDSKIPSPTGIRPKSFKMHTRSAHSKRNQGLANCRWRSLGHLMKLADIVLPAEGIYKKDVVDTVRAD